MSKGVITLKLSSIIFTTGYEPKLCVTVAEVTALNG